MRFTIRHYKGGVQITNRHKRKFMWNLSPEYPAQKTKTPFPLNCTNSPSCRRRNMNHGSKYDMGQAPNYSRCQKRASTKRETQEPQEGLKMAGLSQVHNNCRNKVWTSSLVVRHNPTRGNGQPNTPRILPRPTRAPVSINKYATQIHAQSLAQFHPRLLHSCIKDRSHCCSRFRKRSLITACTDYCARSALNLLTDSCVVSWLLTPKFFLLFFWRFLEIFWIAGNSVEFVFAFSRS